MKLSKINLIRIITISVAAVALTTCVVVGVAKNKVGTGTSIETAGVDHIEITKKPNKLDYFVGEKFSRAGMVVTAFYTNSTSKKVMNYTVDKTDPLTLEDRVVTITFKEKSTTLNINVTEKQVETQIKVETSNTYTYKVEAEDLPFASEELGTDKTQYFEYHNASTGNPNTSGGVSVGKLNFSGENIFLRVNSDVEVKTNIVLSMAFNPSLDFDENVETKWNDEVIQTGFNVSVSSDAKYVWFDWKEYVIPNLTLKKGINELSLRLKDTSKSSPNYDYVKLEVSPVDINEVEGIEVTTKPNKIEYVEGDKFDKEGLVVSALLKDGSKVAINDYSIDKETLALGDDKVTITYKDQFFVSLPITVTRAEIEKLEITSMPQRSSYYMGQKFDKTGLKVTAYSKQGSTQDVTDFLTFDKTYLSKGDTKVIGSYNGKSIEIPVSIDETTNLVIDSDERSNYRIEAEDALWVKNLLVSKEKYNVVDDANASGGKRLDSLDWLKGSSFMVVIDSKVDTTAQLTICSDGPGLDFSQVNPMTFNGEVITLKENPTGGWLNFKPYKANDLITINKGINTLIVNIADNQSVNFDYFEFLVNPSKEELGLTSISLDYTNVKTNYFVCETFDKTGLVVTANYEDGTTKEVTDYEVTSTPLTIDDKEVIISWNNKTATIPVNVSAHINVTEEKSYRLEAEDALFTKGSGDKLIYNIVDDTNASGGKRLDSLDWLAGSTFKIIVNASEEKESTLTICSDGGGAGGNISNFASIKANGNDLTFEQQLNGGWGNLQTITSNTFTLNKGINEVTITITGNGSVNYDYFELNVNKMPVDSDLVSISVDYSNAKTSYYAGETFDKTGLVVTANYKDGTSKVVDNYVISDKVLQLGDTSIEVTYKGQQFIIPITVRVHIDATEGAHRIEAEDALFTKGSGDKEIYNVVDDANASGGKRLDSLDWLAGSTFKIVINASASKEATLTICSDGGGAGGNISNFASIKANGNDLTFEQDLNGGWGNLQTIISNSFNLSEGVNEIVITITGNGSVNYDYFELNVL